VGGVHPWANLVCYPNPEQDGQEGVFSLVGFSTNFAESLRKQGKPVPKELLDAEKAPERDRFIFVWNFRNGVQIQSDPEVLMAVVGSNNKMWSTPDFVPEKVTNRFALRLVFELNGRYSRDVLMDGVIKVSVYGRCEPVQ
jgi:hypothetical protein